MEKALTALTALTAFNRFANLSTKGFTLIEVLICLAMMAAISTIAAHLFSQQIALLQLDEVSHAFIQDAQLARQLSRQTNQTVTLKPLGNAEFRDWSYGWEITQDVFSSEEAFKTLKQYPLHAGHLKGRIQVAKNSLKDSQQFTDMSAPHKARHISFELEALWPTASFGNTDSTPIYKCISSWVLADAGEAAIPIGIIKNVCKVFESPLK